MRKLTILFAALTLCVGLWAQVPAVGDQFVDATYGLKFQVTAVGEANTVKVISNGYKSTSYTVPAIVSYNDVTFAVTEIGERAFYGRSGLTSVTLPEGLTTIGTSAFNGCSKLTSITLPASVTTIGELAFKGSGLESATFAEGSQLNSIGASAFQNCSKLQTVTLPAALKSIGASAFYNCSKLTPIAFPASLDTIGGSAFHGCTALESITIPASVDTIGEAAFHGCTGLTSIVVEAGNTKYDSRDNCNGIVEKATNTLIAACRNTIIPNTVTILGSYVFYKQPITSITLPEGLTTIGASAFSFCSALQSITIPAGVTTIGGSAFDNCSALQSITIPAGVTTIGQYAFNNCYALTSVTFLGNACQESIANDAFANVGKTDPALLTLPNSWTGTLPDEDGKWYGGVFNLSSTPTALPTLFGDGVKGNKFMHNGQMIIRKGNKSFSVLGREMK